MHSNIFSALHVLVICLLCTLPGFAQEFDETLPPLASEVYAIEGEATAETNAAFWTPAFLSGSSSALTDSLRQGHVYSAVDFAMLSASDKAFQTDDEFVLTPKFQLGWETKSGFGVRGSYWNYEQSFAHARNVAIEPAPLIPGQINRPLYLDYDDLLYIVPLSQTNIYPQDFEAQSGDLEIYQRIVVGQTKLLLGTGLRSIERSQQFEVERTIPDWFVTYGYYETEKEKIEGLGGSLLMEFEHQLFDADSLGLALVVGGRTSYIPGELEVRSSGSMISAPINETFDDEFWINDGHVGLELVNRHRYVTLRLRGQFETQYWNSSVTDNQAFTGTSLSCGLDW